MNTILKILRMAFPFLFKITDKSEKVHCVDKGLLENTNRQNYIQPDRVTVVVELKRILVSNSIFKKANLNIFVDGQSKYTEDKVIIDDGLSVAHTLDNLINALYGIDFYKYDTRDRIKSNVAMGFDFSGAIHNISDEVKRVDIIIKFI